MTATIVDPRTGKPFGEQPEDSDPKYAHTHRSGPMFDSPLAPQNTTNSFAELANALDPDYKAPAQIYLTDPVAWIHDMINWERVGRSLAPYQEEILGDLPIYKRESVRGPHGLGKTTIAALAVLWFAITRDAARLDWKIPTTASAWKQLEYYLWPEIKKWIRFLDWEAIGRRPFLPNVELLHTALKLRFGQAFATASDIPENIEGAHADQLLYVFDESKTIPAATFDATEGAFAGANGTDIVALALSISTPGAPVGRFYEIQIRRPGTEDWKVRAVTLDEAIAAGRVSPEWAQNRKRQWGEFSAMYQNRVLGNFAHDATDGVIPLEWVEAAMGRTPTVQVSRILSVVALPKDDESVDADGRQTQDPPDEHTLEAPASPALTSVAVDVAGSGHDSSIIAPRFGRIIGDLIPFHGAEPMELTGHVVEAIRSQAQGGIRGAYATVDANGIGAGVVSRLRELGFDVEAFFGSDASDWTDESGELEFLNRRAAAWWGLRELLDPSRKYKVVLPDDEELLSDLCAPKYRRTSSGKIAVEEKEQIKKRLGRSPDRGDAVVMAFADRVSEPQSGVLIYDEPVAISPY